jgi:hypothetical protein
MNATNSFKLTYSTMFDPPAELHQRFDQSQTVVDSGRLTFTALVCRMGTEPAPRRRSDDATSST